MCANDEHLAVVQSDGGGDLQAADVAFRAIRDKNLRGLAAPRLVEPAAQSFPHRPLSLLRPIPASHSFLNYIIELHFFRSVQAESMIK